MRHGGTCLIFLEPEARNGACLPVFRNENILKYTLLWIAFNQNKSKLRLSCHKVPYFTPKHYQKMFRISLKFTKKLLEAGALPQTPLAKLRTHPIPGPLVGSSLLVPLPRGVQRHPRQCKMRHRNLQERQNKEVGGQRLNVVS